jgi:hypothetical protein
MSKLLHAVNLAQAGLKSLALAIVFVLCGAMGASAQTAPIYLTCPEDGNVNCFSELNDIMPSIAYGAAIEAGYSVSPVVFSDVIIEEISACTYTLSRTWTVTFTSEATSFSEFCTAIYSVDDLLAPVIVNAPADAAYQCQADVPAQTELTAIDNCNGEMPVPVVEFASASANDTLVCNSIYPSIRYGSGLSFRFNNTQYLILGVNSKIWFLMIDSVSPES